MSKRKLVEMKPFEGKELAFKHHKVIQTSPSDFDWGAERNWTFSNEPFDLSRLNGPKSIEKVQNRIGINGQGLSRDHIQGYLYQIRNGSKLPGMCIAEWVGEQGVTHLLIWDGLHTYKALTEAEATHVQGIYFFTHPNPERLAPLFNLLCNGVGANPVDHVTLCARLYFDYRAVCENEGSKPMAQKVWAEEQLCDEKAFNRALARLDMRRECSRHFVNVENITSKTTWDHLSQIAQSSEPVAYEVAKMAADLRLKAKEVGDIKEGLKTTSKPLEFLEERRQILQGSVKGGKPVPPVGGRKKRSNEVRFRDEVVKLATLVDRLDHNKVEHMLSNKGFSKAMYKLSSYFNRMRPENPDAVEE